jgi:hypothetical protein
MAEALVALVLFIGLMLLAQLIVWIARRNGIE